MAEPNGPRPGTILVLSFSPRRPKERVLVYLNDLAESGISVDFVVWDAERWRTTELLPALPTQVRIHELKPTDRRLFTQRLKGLVIYRIPGWILAKLNDAMGISPLTRPMTPAVEFAQKVHGRAGRLMERRIFAVYNRVGRPLRLARVANRVLRDAVDFDAVARIVSVEPDSVTYAWRLSKLLPGVATTITLDRSPLVSAVGTT